MGCDIFGYKHIFLARYSSNGGVKKANLVTLLVLAVWGDGLFVFPLLSEEISSSPTQRYQAFFSLEIVSFSSTKLSLKIFPLLLR